MEQNTHHPPRTVLFVDYSIGGELATRLRELVSRLAPVIGFGIKIVERAGSTLKNSFPLNNLWEGIMCGRDECIPCTQGAEQQISYLPVHNHRWSTKMYVIYAMREQPIRRRSHHSGLTSPPCTWGRLEGACMSEQMNTGEPGEQTRMIATF